MAKKKFNELDASSITLDRIIAHANPSTGKADRGPVSDLIALLTAQTPVKTYADETALLANTNLAIGYIAYNADTGAFYLYNGPTRTDINNYTQISGTDHFQGIYVSSASLTSSVPSAEPGDYAFVDEGPDYPVELWIWDEDDTEWIQSGATGGTVLSVSGTTNRITSTGGATPVIDIDAAYDAAITAQIVAAAVGLWDDRGTFDASVNAYPSSGGSGTAGAILKGDIWTISVAGTLPTGQVVEIGDTVRALIDTPGNTQANWAILQNNIGFVPAPIASPTFTGTPAAPTAAVGTDTTQVATTAFVHDEVVGVQDLFIPASAFWPRVTAGCSPLAQTEIATSLINIQTLDFNQTTQQYAQTHYKFPKKYNLGTLTYEIEWTATTGTGSVVWGVAAVALADGDVLTTVFGSQVNVTDAAGTANTERNSATSAAVTIGNTPAVADGIYLQITRVTGDGSDDMAADAKFKGISIHITTNAATDA